MCRCFRKWNILLTGFSCGSWQPYVWHHCCISMSSRHMGQTYRLWVDDMLTGWDHHTFLSTRVRSSNKMSRFMCTFYTHVHVRRSLNNTWPCTKNNVQRQLVEMITRSGVNDKFPRKQTLTECVTEPYISQLRRPWPPPLGTDVL